MYWPRVVATALAIAWIGAAHSEPRTSDEWLRLVVEIQRDLDQADFENRPPKNINGEDRRFVQKMMNELTATNDAMPTAAQAKWLLAIKDWVRK